MAAKKTRRSKQVAEHFPPLKAINLSEEEREMFRRCDYVGLEYLHCEEFRKRRKKTPEMLARIEKHDAEEQKILNDPKTALREAHSSIDRGVSLLLKLIRSRMLFHIVEPTEKGKAAGVEAHEWDESFDCLASRITDLNDQLIRLAEDKVPRACRQLWFDSKKLAEAFTRLAISHAKEFRNVAKDSVTMPSLRARNSKFTADSQAIIEAVHLGEEHPNPDISDNRSRVGAMCHLLVVQIIDRIHFSRREYEWERDGVERLKEFHETADRYRGASVEQVLRARMHPQNVAHVLACAALPSWENNPRAWWKGRVLPLVKEGFQQLARCPSQNPALWEELKRGGERNTVNDMRRYMEKICKNKFDQIVKAASA